jgi:predicted RNA-binding Zn ribbon-like protein
MPIPPRIVPAPAASLCLDFVNTRYWRGTPQPSEELGDADALRRWLQRHGEVDEVTPRQFNAAIEARESLYGLLRTLAEAAAPPADALAALARQVAAAPPRRELVLAPQQAGWQIPLRSPGVAALLAPVWWSAADLVLAADRLRPRCCANPRCGWLFLDDSKGGTRRWCSMSACGNRAKVQRHALRQRSLKAPVRPAKTR